VVRSGQERSDVRMRLERMPGGAPEACAEVNGQEQEGQELAQQKITVRNRCAASLAAPRGARTAAQ